MTQQRPLEGYYLQQQRLKTNGIVRLCFLASRWFGGNLFKLPFPPLPYSVNEEKDNV